MITQKQIYDIIDANVVGEHPGAFVYGMDEAAREIVEHLKQEEMITEPTTQFDFFSYLTNVLGWIEERGEDVTYYKKDIATLAIYDNTHGRGLFLYKTVRCTPTFSDVQIPTSRREADWLLSLFKLN